MTDINLPFILGTALIAVASPGPATLAIAGASMAQGRKHGLFLASGISTGSLIWSSTAAFGLAAIMLANVWLFEAMRYVAGAYLLFLAFKSARSALTKSVPSNAQATQPTNARQSYLKGLAIHLTNPKPILFFGSLYHWAFPIASRRVIFSIW